MKRICSLLLTLALVLGLCACGQKAETTPTWQEQYDLGVKYLSEGNHQEAIIAFTAAIEIDPKQPEAYIGLADVYTAQGDTDAAKKALEDGLAATGDDSVRARLEQLEAQLSAAAIPQVGPAVDPLPVARTERTDGDTFSYVFEYSTYIVTYGEDGSVIGTATCEWVEYRRHLRLEVVDSSLKFFFKFGNFGSFDMAVNKRI